MLLLLIASHLQPAFWTPLCLEQIGLCDQRKLCEVAEHTLSSSESNQVKCFRKVITQNVITQNNIMRELVFFAIQCLSFMHHCPLNMDSCTCALFEFANYITYDKNQRVNDIKQKKNKTQDMTQQASKYYLLVQQKEGQLNVCLAAFISGSSHQHLKASLAITLVQHLAWLLHLFLTCLPQCSLWSLCLCHDMSRGC